MVIVSVIVSVIVLVIGLVNVVGVRVVCGVVVAIFNAGVGVTNSREVKLSIVLVDVSGLLRSVRRINFVLLLSCIESDGGSYYFVWGIMVVMITPFGRSVGGGCIIIFTI